ncbi:hypothetical protein SVAN01_05955 [Stagonosporopsis vannaccii]|nr:hypothetical protein SVAN01_05955 [Stagonosporopsis vannaccii]
MARISEMLAQPSSTTGAASSCAQYFTHYLPALIEQPQPHNARDWQSHYSCANVADRYNVDVEQLMRWNPSLSGDDCVLQPGVEYCVVKIEKTDRPSVPLPEKTSAEPPICTFDPKKGEYECPEPPICSFDPHKGEYLCPHPTSTGGPEEGHHEGTFELK